MPVSSEYAAYVLEMLEPVGPVHSERFFGGLRICHGSTQFAMVMGNSLYFAVDDSTRGRYEAAGMTAFSFMTKKGRKQIPRYFELPEEVLSDPETLKEWARQSLQTAANRTKTPGLRRKRPIS